MNNLEVILESILNEGNTKRDEIINEASLKAEEMISESIKQGEMESNKIVDEAEKEAHLIKENETITSLREARDIEIAAKNEVIDEVVDKLLDRLKDLDLNSYTKFIENTLSRSKISKGEILLDKKHRDSLKDKDFNSLKVSDDTVEDGFVIRSGKIEYDNRFSSIVKYNIDDIKKQISDEIFK